MIGKLALILANFTIKETTFKDQNLDILRFRIHVFLNFLLVFLFSCSISITLDTFKATIIGYLFFFQIRIVSGGAWHFKNDLICFIFSTAIMVLMPTIHINDTTQIIFNYFSLIIFIILSPVSKRIPVKSTSWWVFKIIGLSFLLLNTYFIQSKLLTVVFLVQAISIINLKRGKRS